MYYFQALIFSVGIGLLTQRHGRLSAVRAVMILAWFLGVSLIYWRYGPIGQLSFYQNDQSFHWQLVTQAYGLNLNFSFRYLNYLRFPYTGPAYLLTQVGFDPTLSLKFVSLCCALANVALIEKFLARRGYNFSSPVFWLIAGPISTFFSLLALRETMMLLCVSQLFLGISQSGKALSLLVLVFLRPHLAAAIIVGQLWGWALSKTPRRWYLPATVVTAIVPMYLGIVGFSLGGYIINQLPLQLNEHFFLKSQMIQIFSVFTGLQFLTVASQTIEFATGSLLLIRLIFPEIVLVPLLFATSNFFFTPQITRLKLSVLATVMFFTSLSSETDFLSTRQSLPMMSIMGVVIILAFVRPHQLMGEPQETAQLTTV